MANNQIRVADIVVGHRHRQDLGDIAALVASIRDLGLLQPIVVTPQHKLIAGRRRLAAVRELKWTTVPVHIVTSLDDAYKLLLAERDENTCRKALAPSEAGALGEALEVLEREAAKKRQATAGPKSGKGKKATASGNLPETVGRSRDKAAAALGMSGRTYEKIQVVRAAAREEPDRFGRVQKWMDQTGRVDPAYQAVIRARAGNSAVRRRDRDRAEAADTDAADYQMQIDAAHRMGRALASTPVETIVGAIGRVEAERHAETLDEVANQLRKVAADLRMATKEESD